MCYCQNDYHRHISVKIVICKHSSFQQLKEKIELMLANKAGKDCLGPGKEVMQCF